MVCFCWRSVKISRKPYDQGKCRLVIQSLLRIPWTNLNSSTVLWKPLPNYQRSTLSKFSSHSSPFLSSKSLRWRMPQRYSRPSECFSHQCRCGSWLAVKAYEPLFSQRFPCNLQARWPGCCSCRCRSDQDLAIVARARAFYCFYPDCLFHFRLSADK